MSSPFLTPGPVTTDNSLALLHLRRDLSLPTILLSGQPPASASTTTTALENNSTTKKQRNRDDTTGYAEGYVANTRFGSFPHSTLLNVRWGSQVKASIVDTGSRGRKRKAPEPHTPTEGEKPEDEAQPLLKAAIPASSGFVHILPPTPEGWTSSLPHRTQVVYTPDYSYILHRLRARPGTRLIESGSGSGSFGHAAARAVFNGYPEQEEADGSKRRKLGKVFSYEFHRQRAEKVKEEMREHGLDSVVQCMERDVYKDGFLLSPPSPISGAESPAASAVFLDLPAPWLAIPHLTRSQPSALDPSATVHICTFSPCIEQVTRTVTTLRQHGWTSIEMVEVAQKRIDVRREVVGLDTGKIRGANAVARNVNEAVARLREVEGRARAWTNGKDMPTLEEEDGEDGLKVEENESILRDSTRFGTEENVLTGPTADTTTANAAAEDKCGAPEDKKLFKLGRLIHRSEPDLKTHTSYLVFAILPREWSDADEATMREKWATTSTTAAKDGKAGTTMPKSRRQEKKEARATRAVERSKEMQRKKIGGHDEADVDMES